MFCHVAEQETLYLHRVVRIGTDGAGDKVVGTLILRIVLVFSIDNKPWCDSAAKANVNRLRTPLGDPSQVYRALGIAPFGRDPDHKGTSDIFRTKHVGNFIDAILWRESQQAIQPATNDIAADREPAIGQRDAAV